MKVKCIKDYYDLELKRTVKADEEIEVTAARGKALTTTENKAGCVLCQEVSTPIADNAAEAETVKKSRKKKEE